MGVLRTTTSIIAREICRQSLFSSENMRCLFSMPSPAAKYFAFGEPKHRLVSRGISYCPVRCAAASKEDGDGGKKPSARLSQVQEFLLAANERAQAAGDEPPPQITLDHVTVNFARSGGPGGQNVNKVNTKVDMRFNVKNADWLSDRVKERILQVEGLSAGVARESVIYVLYYYNPNFYCRQQEKNRINKDGELVISSTKTRTQKGNIEDALAKLQAIIDAASYVPPPPSEETVKKITKLAAIGEQKRLDKKKALSQKKAFRRSRDSWD